MNAALPLPSTDRLLRGLLTALGEIDVADRPDLEHQVRMMRLVVGHLVRRRDLSGLADLYADMTRLSRQADSRLGILRAVELPEKLSIDSYDAAQGQIGAAFAALSDAISKATRVCVSDSDTLWHEAQQLESRFYALATPSPAETASVPALTRERFQDYLREKFVDWPIRVTNFRRLMGGFQKETILVDAEQAAGELNNMVIRAEKHDRLVRMTASEIVDEYAIVQLMYQRGVPVAKPLWLEADAQLLGRRFMVSRRAVGVNTGSAYGNSRRFPPALVSSFLRTLAQIHSLPIDAEVSATTLGNWLKFGTLAENTRAEIAFWRNQIWMDRAPASPGFTRLFDWLEANVPEEEEAPCILHNDYGPHNILVHDDAVSAVLDWEVPRLGDRAEDLSFFLQCAGEAIDPAEAVAIYGEYAGCSISRFRMAYFDVLSCAKVLVSTLSATAMYQATESALIDWTQMPILAHGLYQQQAEGKIAIAQACRGQ